MKNSRQIEGVNVTVGGAKRESKIYRSDFSTAIELTDVSKAYLNRKNQVAPLTKESKEAKLTLIALVQLGAIGENNAVSGLDVVKAYESLVDSKGLIVNDANKVGRILRSLALKVSDAERNSENWKNPNTIPQTNYFNLEFAYTKVKIGRIGETDNKSERLTAKYYLKRPVALESLNVRGFQG